MTDYCYGKGKVYGSEKDFKQSDEDYMRQWYGNMPKGAEEHEYTDLLYDFSYVAGTSTTFKVKESMLQVHGYTVNTKKDDQVLDEYAVQHGNTVETSAANSYRMPSAVDQIWLFFDKEN